MLPNFLDTEQEIPGYCVGQIVSITLLLKLLLGNSILFFFCDGFKKKCTGFGSEIVSRCTPFESFLMSSISDDDLDISRSDI